MDLFTPMTFAIAIPAVIFAGISKGGFGSGISFASAAILALVLDPRVALGLMLPLLLLIDGASLPAFWRKWDWAVSKVLMLGAVPGTVIGGFFLAYASPDLIRLLIGLICVAFVVWQSLRYVGWLRLERQKFRTKTGLLAGFGMGFTSFISHAGGPIAAIYLLGQHLPKTTYHATTVLVFGVVNVLKFFGYVGMGLFPADTLLVCAALAPFAIFGTWLGVKAHYLVPERVFFAVTYIGLTLTGLRLIWVALT